MKRRPYGRDLGLTIRARGDLRGGLAVQALCILPARTRGWRRFELFAHHPPLEKRLERLEELWRELGKTA